ncbi:hypothetical protein Esti_001748 [Eimeria stiedai]
MGPLPPSFVWKPGRLPPGLFYLVTQRQQRQQQQRQQQLGCRQQPLPSHLRRCQQRKQLYLHAPRSCPRAAAFEERPSLLLLGGLGRQHVLPQQQQQRSISSFMRTMRRLQWPLMRAEMCAFFAHRLRGPARSLEELHKSQQQQQQRLCMWRSSSVNVEARPWERFVSSEQLRAEGYVPCVVKGKGPYRKLAVSFAALHDLAFDEAEGHLSFLFKARVFHVHVGPMVELCVAKEVKADPRKLFVAVLPETLFIGVLNEAQPFLLLLQLPGG